MRIGSYQVEAQGGGWQVRHVGNGQLYVVGCQTKARAIAEAERYHSYDTGEAVWEPLRKEAQA